MKTARTELDPIEYAAQYLWIYDKARRLIPLRYNEAQRHYLANRTERDLILKARQLGFSTVIQAEFSRQVWTRPAASLTMADVDKNTMKLRRVARRFYDHLPEEMQPVLSENNASTTIFPGIGSETAIATAGAATSGRASTFNLFHGSEVAFWREAARVMSGALQSVPLMGETWVALESTANGAQGWFYDRSMEALHDPEKSTWKLHFYPWWWSDEYQLPLFEGEEIVYTDDEKYLCDEFVLSPEQIKWRRFKMRELPETFLQEYPEDPVSCFLTSGRTVFTVTPNIFNKRVEEYNKDHIYVMGIDWGQSEDYTSRSIVDTNEYREVFLDRARRRSWESMRLDIIEDCKRWNIEKIEAEKNSMGTVNIEDLINDLQAAGLTTVVEPFTTTNRKLDKIVKLMQRGFSEDDFQVLDIDYATRELRAFETKQLSSGVWTYSHPTGGHDDTVIARMLAHYVALQFN